MATVHLNIGSNMGDRCGNIGRAVALIGDRAGRVLAVSDEVESEPWGYESDARFINVGVNVETSLTPLQLLDCVQAIEREISDTPHRKADGSYRDRVIDIDIIMYGREVIESERLVVPHRHWAEREFVTRPLAEIGTGMWLDAGGCLNF